jgi:hypothetical protein
VVFASISDLHSLLVLVLVLLLLLPLLLLLRFAASSPPSKVAGAW